MFLKYPKIYRLGVEENDGILNGLCYVQEKIDGANTQIWMEYGVIKCGSRSKELEEGFNGFVNYVQSHEGIKQLLTDNPNFRLYGEWLCLSGDTVIKKVAGGRGGKGNYMTIREMYEYSIKKENGRNVCWWKRYGMPSIFSLNKEKDKVLPNKIKRIEFTGNKEVFEIKTREGFTIKTTKEHKILTQKGYVEVKNIDINKDVVAITSLCSERTNKRNLGVGSRDILKKQKEFVKNIGKCNFCDNKTSLELDHIDENWENNNEENWQVLCSQCHKKKSGLSQNKTKPHSKGYSYRFDKIISIVSCGIEDTYDIEMDGDENSANFVANNFIVHNCRHTISYNELSYRNWYMFDILLDDKEWLELPVVYNIAKKYNILTPELFACIDNPILEQLMPLVGKTVLGEKGEGIVIKNFGFVNKFLNNSYAKIVTEKFKEDNAICFGGNNRHSESYNEMYICNKFITLGRIQKILNKIQSSTDEKLDMKHIPRVMGMTYNDLWCEEAWYIAKNFQQINLRKLQQLCYAKTKQIYIEIITGDVSVAHQ